MFTDIEGDTLHSEPRSETPKPASNPATSATTAPIEQNAQPKVTAKPLPPTPRHSAFDQAKSKKSDLIIVPAGTEIRVDLVEGKVVVPVRVGFATPIPALSIASVKVNQAYYTPVFSVVSNSPGNAPVAFGENAELTAVTVRGVTYPVQANTVPLTALGAGRTRSLMSDRDTVFVLSAPLAIER